MITINVSISTFESIFLVLSFCVLIVVLYGIYKSW